MEDIQFWEARLQREEQKLKELPESIRELVYWRDVVPYKNIVRHIRIKSDIPVCCGASDCLAYPTVTCSAGSHDTCPNHAGTCFYCKSSEAA